jgi:hypothetical protein
MSDSQFNVWILHRSSSCFTRATNELQSKKGRELNALPLRHREAPSQTARQAAPDGGVFGQCLWAWKIRGFQ